jgi:hypothetical protein
MKILIWKSYGDIRVYDVSTPEKLKVQIENAIECLDGWGLEKEIILVEKHIEKYPDNLTELMKAFNTIRNAINPGSEDMFEQFYIDDLI